MEQGGLMVFLPAPLRQAGTFPEDLKVHHATRGEEEKPCCAVEPQRPQCLQSGMEMIKKVPGLSHQPCAGHY